jgi:outer membrane lipoprotein carrier protein
MRDESRVALGLATALLLLPLASASAQSAPDGNAVAARAANAYRRLTSLEAAFSQRIDDPMVGLLESAGRVWQAGNDRLAMRFSDPAGEAVVMDGRHLWIYTPSTAPGQVLRLPVPERPTYGFNVLAWILDRPTERYRVRYLRADRIEGRTMDVIEMIPREEDMPFTRAVVWLDRADALPRRLEVREPGGSLRTIDLSGLKPNAPVSRKTFEFEVPRGTRVVEG